MGHYDAGRNDARSEARIDIATRFDIDGALLSLEAQDASKQAIHARWTFPKRRMTLPLTLILI